MVEEESTPAFELSTAINLLEHQDDLGVADFTGGFGEHCRCVASGVRCIAVTCWSSNSPQHHVRTAPPTTAALLAREAQTTVVPIQTGEACQAIVTWESVVWTTYMVGASTATNWAPLYTPTSFAYVPEPVYLDRRETTGSCLKEGGCSTAPTSPPIITTAPASVICTPRIIVDDEGNHLATGCIPPVTVKITKSEIIVKANTTTFQVIPSATEGAGLAADRIMPSPYDFAKRWVDTETKQSTARPTAEMKLGAVIFTVVLVSELLTAWRCVV